jgi:hypothetical protein
MKEIELTQGMVAIVDDDNYEELSKYNWCFSRCRSPNEAPKGYAIRGGRPDEVKVNILMHRAIMKTPDGMLVDHIDGNGLNNQKCNMRNCTTSENLANHIRAPWSNSGFYGVSRRKDDLKWQAKIKIHGRTIYIGSFDDPEEAARSRDIVAIKLFGEFAALNFGNKRVNPNGKACQKINASN